MSIKIYKIYSKSDCGWCVKAKQLMNDLGLRYQELKLGEDYTKEDLRKMLGEHLPLTVPQIYIDDKRIGGYEDFAEYCENTGIMGLQS